MPWHFGLYLHRLRFIIRLGARFSALHPQKPFVKKGNHGMVSKCTEPWTTIIQSASTGEGITQSWKPWHCTKKELAYKDRLSHSLIDHVPFLLDGIQIWWVWAGTARVPVQPRDTRYNPATPRMRNSWPGSLQPRDTDFEIEIEADCMTA